MNLSPRFLPYHTIPSVFLLWTCPISFFVYPHLRRIFPSFSPILFISCLLPFRRYSLAILFFSLLRVPFWHPFLRASRCPLFVSSYLASSLALFRSACSFFIYLSAYRPRSSCSFFSMLVLAPSLLSIFLRQPFPLYPTPSKWLLLTSGFYTPEPEVEHVGKFLERERGRERGRGRGRKGESSSGLARYSNDSVSLSNTCVDVLPAVVSQRRGLYVPVWADCEIFGDRLVLFVSLSLSRSSSSISSYSRSLNSRSHWNGRRFSSIDARMQMSGSNYGRVRLKSTGCVLPVEYYRDNSVLTAIRLRLWTALGARPSTTIE